MTRVGRAALAYARKGWPVFPVHWAVDGRCSCGEADCDRVAKHPLSEHGWKDATTELEIVRRWWTRWPQANIGHPTGERIVLDVDGADRQTGGPPSLPCLPDRRGRPRQRRKARVALGHSRLWQLRDPPTVRPQERQAV